MKFIRGYGLFLLVGLGLSRAAGWAAFLTDPFLQAVTSDSVRVVWITDQAGSANEVEYGPGWTAKQTATTRGFTRLGQAYRHEAVITGLAAGSYEYRVRTDGLTSGTYSFRPAPASGGVRLLLISDAQKKPLVDDTMAAVEKYGGHLDVILFAGDLVDVPDEVAQWWSSDFEKRWAFQAIAPGSDQYQ